MEKQFIIICELRVLFKVNSFNIMFTNSSLTTRPASWETYMQVRKQKLELDMEQQTGSK